MRMCYNKTARLLIRLTLTLLPVALACLYPFVANATEDDAYSALDKFTRLTEKEFTNGSCSVGAVSDFNEALPFYPVFRDAWLNRDFSEDFYLQRRKQVFLFVILKRFAEVITEGLYRDTDHKNLDKCHFKIEINYKDKYGNDKLFPAIGWDFTREVADKIHWESFDPRDFQEIALNFHISAQAGDWISDEPSFASEKRDDNVTQCDVRYLRANAIFMRATTYCKKDYLDSPAGMYALEKSRLCKDLPKDRVMSFLSAAFNELDAIAKRRGPRQACNWVDDLEANVLQSIGK